MKKILLIIAFIHSLNAQNIELNLKQFAELVSSQHLVNIIIDDTVEHQKFSFFVQRDKNTILLSAFKKMLELKKLNLHYDRKNNFYYIEPFPMKQHPKAPKKFLYTIKLKTLIYKELKTMLDHFPDLKHSYIKNTNTVIMHSTQDLYKQFKEIITDNDGILEQFQLKITIIETNQNEVDERGVQINAYTSQSVGDVQYFINLLTMPSTANTNIFDDSMSGFTASLHFLDSIGVSKIKSSPYVTVQSGKNVFFSSVENVPYQIATSAVNGASQSAQVNTEYKDVGLKIDLTPTILNDIVFIDLDFTIEAIIGERTSTPTTSKRELKNSFQLRKNQILVLSGLENTLTSTSTIGIPVLMKIPYVGQMFRFDVDSQTKKSLSIMIEII